ncbi:MAG: hypothetical protein KAU07_04565 [Candidatus Andersenbacteria bacterium]|nr:hypothetical protein [Candidatus Andersenbacteria bacterium]
MSSINLLPRIASSKYEAKREIKIAPFISFLMIIFPILFSIFLYFSNQNSFKEVESLNMKIGVINEEIEKEVSSNEFLLAETKGSKVSFFLSRHAYFSEAIYFLQDNLMDEVFIKSLEISFTGEEYVDININGIVKNYSSIATQLYVLKSLPAVEDFSIKSISKNEWGDLDFNGDLKLDKKIIVYSEKSGIVNK